MKRRQLIAWATVTMALAIALVLLMPAVKADATTGAKQPAVGSITLLLAKSADSSESPMEGGQIALYRVAMVDAFQGQAYDVTAGQFASSAAVKGIPAMTKEELDDRNFHIAGSLETEIARLGIEPLQVVSVTDGKVNFPAVEEGLYLIVQANQSKSGQSMGAFLMSVPNYAGELDVVCRPKPGVPDDGGKKDDSGGGGSNEGATTSSKKSAQASTASPSSIGLRVPATGDRPTTGLPLAAGGVVLVLAGILVRRRIGRSERTS